MKEIAIRELMNRQAVTCGMDADPLELATSMRNNHYSCIVVVENDIPLGIVTERDVVRVFVDYYREESHRKLMLKDVVSTPVISISEDTSLFDAMVLLKSRNIRHLPVVNGEGRMTGIVTYSDLVQNHQRIVDRQIDIIEREVRERTVKLTEANDRLHAMSLEDYLLKIGNRRAMEVDLNYTHDAAMRYQRSYSIALIDVDYFKKYNDRYGHKSGDLVLKQIVNCIKQTIRKSDRLYRFGGEEFLLLLQETAEKGAYSMVQRLHANIEDMAIRHEKSPVGRITVSSGIMSIDAANEISETWCDYLAKADAALYQAKENGRNLCVLNSPANHDAPAKAMQKKSAA